MGRGKKGNAKVEERFGRKDGGVEGVSKPWERR